MEYSPLFQQLNDKHSINEQKRLAEQSDIILRNEEELPDLVRRMSKKLHIAGYPFALSGSDRAVEFNNILHPAWHLTTNYAGKLHVFMLGDGTLVSNNDFFSNVVGNFDIIQAKPKDLADIRKTLISYLRKDSSELRAIPLENTSRQLQELLPQLKWMP